ncbi:MAG: hypothetical protein AAB974_00600 [Patescibacteria group bacterium]
MNPLGQRALRFYLAVLRFFWTPLIGLARFVARHPIIVSFGISFCLGVAFVLKTGGVLVAADLGFVTVGRIAIVAGGFFDLAATVVTSAIGALVLYWFLIAVGMVQIPVGEIMEVFRELGQMLRLQDPVKRDNEGNIRAINTDKLLQWGMLLLMVPGTALMSTVWLAAFPHWAVYKMLLLISGGGLAYGVFAAVRGRKVGAGIDLLLGMNAYLVVGGVITLLASMVGGLFLPQWTGVVTGALGSSSHGIHYPPADGIDGLFANVWARLLHGDIVWTWPPHAGDVTGVVVGVLLIAAFLALHIAALAVIVRMLRIPPDREQKTVSVAAPAGITVSGTAGRGDSGFSGFSMNGWLWSAIGFGLLAVILWLVNHYASGEYVCRFGGAFFTLALVLAAIALVTGLLRQYWPRAAHALGALALVCVLFGFTYDALEHWGGRQTACAIDEPPAAPTATVPARRTYEPAQPPRRSSPYEPRSSGDGRIATYFAANGAQCPDAARRRGWESLRDAQASCRSESWLAQNADWR